MRVRRTVIWYFSRLTNTRLEAPLRYPSIVFWSNRVEGACAANRMLTRPRSKDARWVSYLVLHGRINAMLIILASMSRKLTDNEERFRAVQFFGLFADNFPSFQHYVTDSAEMLIDIFKSASQVESPDWGPLSYKCGALGFVSHYPWGNASLLDRNICDLLVYALLCVIFFSLIHLLNPAHCSFIKCSSESWLS